MPGPVEVPSVEELDVPELAVGSAVLKAGAHHYGSQCDRINKEFMLCRWEEMDPRKCLNEGRAVSKCAVDFFRQVKLHCAEPFNQYWNCLDETNMLQLQFCRKQQQLFDDCVLDKLGWVRPELGQLSKVTKVNTVRPTPENPCHSQMRPAANPPTEGEYKPAKYGNRGYFWSW